jgi:hypothetical protein
MDQFGLRMDFLLFIQVIGIVSILKTYFLIHFPDFITLWTWPQYLENAGVLTQKKPRHRGSDEGTVGWFPENRGA